MTLQETGIRPSLFAGRFNGRRAIVTGGGSGLGLLTAARITAEGGQVSLWDMNTGALDKARTAMGAVHAATSMSPAMMRSSLRCAPAARPWAASTSW